MKFATNIEGHNTGHRTQPSKQSKLNQNTENMLSATI